MSMTPEEYTADLVRRILPTVTEFHGYLSQQAAEHLVTEAFFAAANDVRRGRMAKLDYLGDFARIDDRVSWRASDYISAEMTQAEVANYDKENAA